MTLPEQILLALKNVVRAGTRTVLCVLAICIGITSVNLIVSIGGMAGESIQSELEQIGVRGVALYTKTGVSFSPEAVQAIAQTEEIAACMPLILTNGSVRLRSQRSNAGILGIDERLDQVFHLTVLHGKLPSKGQVAAGEKIVVVDEELAQKAYKRSNVGGKTLWISVNGIHEKLQICAVIRSQSENIAHIVGGNIPHFIYLPYTTLKALSADLNTDKVLMVTKNSDPITVSEALVNRLERLSGIVYQYENLDQYLSSFSKITNILTVLIGGVAAISVIVGGLGVMNAMTASIEARTREIGIYRALGAKRRYIILIFLIESVFLCLIGGFMGIVFHWILLTILGTLLKIRVAFRINGIILSIAMAILCGVGFGWLPAMKAANLDPIQAIRMK
jgi:putative ABC transport system permease protein